MTDVPLDLLFENMASGKIIRAHFSEGDWVSASAVLVVVETEKAVFEVAAPCDGYLRKVYAGVGSEVPVGSILCTLTSAEQDAFPDRSEDNRALLLKMSSVSGSGPSPRKQDRGEVQQDADVDGRIKALPAARLLARSLGIDLAAVKQFTGGKVIKEEDVRRFANR